MRKYIFDTSFLQFFWIFVLWPIAIELNTTATPFICFLSPIFHYFLLHFQYCYPTVSEFSDFVDGSPHFLYAIFANSHKLGISRWKYRIRTTYEIKLYMKKMRMKKEIEWKKEIESFGQSRLCINAENRIG